jgi:hypothetical protein
VRIHRSNPAGDFAIIPNETLRDERLSFAARGHLVYLLSRPDDWKTSADDEAERARRLRSRRGEGREAMRRVYKELKDAGYMHLVRSAGASGRWTTETHVFDRPCAEVRPADVPESRMPESPAETESSQVAPTYGKPGVGSPGVGSADRRFTRTSKEKTDYEDGIQQPQGQDQGQNQGQGPDALRLPQVRNSQKPASSRLNEQAADDAEHFAADDLGCIAAGTGTRARRTDTPAA